MSNATHNNKVFAIANQKGGVGKTTTSINLAASLAETRRRVLLIDLDPQGNATMGCGIDKNKCQTTINEVLLGVADAASACINVHQALSVLPANQRLTVAEVRLLKMSDRERQLCKHLQPLRDNYDFIFIDCPPSLNILTVNAFVAADAVIVPIQCEYYALEGLAALLKTVEQLRQHVNPRLKVEGLLRTMYDGRTRLSLDVSKQLIDHFGDTVYQTVIPRNVRLAEAPSHGKPIFHYDPNSQGAAAYLALAAELLRRQAATRRQEEYQKEDTAVC